MSEKTDRPHNLFKLQSGGRGGCSLSLLCAESPDLLTMLEGAADCFMSYGAYHHEGQRLLSTGICNGAAGELHRAVIPEDISHSWLHHQSEPRYSFEGVTLNYQIIAPTNWNFSPRDAQATPGALEQALMNAPVREGERDPVSVQYIVGSFDPCMVSTVH